MFLLLHAPFLAFNSLFLLLLLLLALLPLSEHVTLVVTLCIKGGGYSVVVSPVTAKDLPDFVFGPEGRPKKEKKKVVTNDMCYS